MLKRFAKLIYLMVTIPLLIGALYFGVRCVHFTLINRSAEAELIKRYGTVQSTDGEDSPPWEKYKLQSSFESSKRTLDNEQPMLILFVFALLPFQILVASINYVVTSRFTIPRHLYTKDAG